MASLTLEQFRDIKQRGFPAWETAVTPDYEGFEAVNWTGLVAPTRTPAPIVARLNEEGREALSVSQSVAFGTGPTAEDPFSPASVSQKLTLSAYGNQTLASR